MGFLDDLVSINVSTRTRTPARRGFGTALILAYHTKYADRVRTYSSLAGLVSDGFKTSDPVYKIAAALLAQPTSVKTFKVGRRALPFTQTVDLTPTSPAASEVYTVEVDGLSATFTADGTPTVAEACTGVAAAINGLADADAIIATGVSIAGVQTLSGASLDGVVGYRSMSVARKLAFVFSSHADWDATTITVTGTDMDGAVITEDFAVPNGGNATVNGTKFFKAVTSVSIPAQSGTGGTYTFGTQAPVSATGASATKVVCTATAGELHTFKVRTSNNGVLNLTIKDATADPGIATDLGNVLATDADWYGLLLDSQSQAEVATASTGAAAWVEANKRILIAQTADGLALSSSSITDVGYVLHAAGYARTGLLYTPGLYTEWHAAAWMGNRLPADPGSDTWAFKGLSGVSVYALTDTQRASLDAKYVNYYIDGGGLAITYPGVSSAGEFLDVTRFVDWLKARMQERVLAVQVNNDKIPFTDRGIALVVAEVRAQIQQGVNVGGIADDPAFTVSYPRASEVSSSDRAARRLSGVTFNGRLAGAIHELDITGNVTA